MPDVIPMIPDEMVLTRLSELDPLLSLTPRQVAMIMAKTERQLEDVRKAGNGPPFDTQNGRVIYYVGQVRDYQRTRMSSHTYHSTLEAKRARDNRVAGFDVAEAKKASMLGFSSLEQFLIYAQNDDQWPFAIVGGKPVDFFESLGMELSNDVECSWLTLGEYHAFSRKHLLQSLNQT